MASEVRHGMNPKFRLPLDRGAYGATIIGRYTKVPGWTAVGVHAVSWNSRRKAKRRAELLGMRTAFLCWFVVTYEKLGGSWAEAVREVTRYPFRRLRKRVVRLRRQKKRIE